MKNYPLYEVERYGDFRTFIDGIAARYASKPALTIYSPEGAPCSRSYERLAEDVRAFAEAFTQLGYVGKNIAVISENSYLSIVSILGCAYMGSAAIPVDMEQESSTIQSMVDFADAECVLLSPGFQELAQQEHLFEGKPCFVLSEGEEEGGMTEILRNAAEHIQTRGMSPLSPIDPGQTAVIVYTSGTTSTSKPVMLSHRALLTNACESVMLAYLPPRVYTSLPLYHVYGLTCALLNNLVDGAEICVNGDIRYMMRDFAMFKPMTMMAVPLIAEMLCKKLLSLAKEAGLSRGGIGDTFKALISGRVTPDTKLTALKEKAMPGLSVMICGGAHLSPNVAKVLLRFGILVLQGYGITECSPLVAVNRNEFYNPETVGVTLPSYEVKIENEEICVKGPCLMNGYYKHPELTAASIVDGWFRTGDLGSFDRNGFLRITGRKKNVIVLKNGKKVSPEELETLLAEIPMVKESMVYGSAVGNDVDDVVPAVTIYPDPAETADMAAYEILSALQRSVDALNEQLPAYKQIRLINIREKEFDKTATKKIKRGQ